MNRKHFISSLGVGLVGTAMAANSPFAWLQSLAEEDHTFPVLFVGHGSPMNAIEDNAYSRGWKAMAAELPKPKAILCISAHWETNGTRITAMKQPRTIHDFGGFPQALFDAQYPAKGDPELAEAVAKHIDYTQILMDHEWGLDHGTWSVLLQMYPEANIPVLQLSLDRKKGAAFHLELAKEFAFLRKRGVLVIGSGNMVHNIGASMREIYKRGSDAFSFNWAEEANEVLKAKIKSGDHTALANYEKLSIAHALAIPTPEHYLPMLYCLGLKGTDEPLAFFNDQCFAGFSMTSFRIG